MSFKNKCLSGFAIIALAIPGAYAETLDQAIAAAIDNNPQLQSQRFQSDIAKEGLVQARSQRLPTVSLSGSAGYQSADSNALFGGIVGDYSSASAQLQAVQPVYTGGRITSGIRRAEAGIGSADKQLESVRQDLILEVVTAYMDVRADREALEIRKNNVTVTGEQVRAAQDRFDVGVVTRTDVSLAQARLEGARAAQAGAEASLVSSEANYSFLTGLMPEELVPPPPIPLLPTSVELAIEQAIANNPTLIAARYDERAAKEAVEIARAQGRPQVNIVGSASAQEFFGDIEREDTNLSAVAQGSVPLFSGGLIRSQIRSAGLQRRQAQERIDTIERQLRAQVAQTWYGYEAAQRAIDASTRQVEAAEIAYNGAKEELAVGVRTTLDVLDQEQQLFEARLSLVQAERDAYVAAHRLLRAVGGLDIGLWGMSVESLSDTFSSPALDETAADPAAPMAEE